MPCALLVNSSLAPKLTLFATGGHFFPLQHFEQKQCQKRSVILKIFSVCISFTIMVHWEFSNFYFLSTLDILALSLSCLSNDNLSLIMQRHLFKTKKILQWKFVQQIFILTSSWSVNFITGNIIWRWNLKSFWFATFPVLLIFFCFYMW